MFITKHSSAVKRHCKLSMHLPPYPLAILILIQAACVIAIALVIKRLYRLATSQFLTADPIKLPNIPNKLDDHPLSISVQRDGAAPNHPDWLFTSILYGLARWGVYAASGAVVLYLADWMFFPAQGRSTRFEDYDIVIGLMITVMLVVGQLRIRVASSGLWVFAYVIGFAWGSAIFGIVFVSIPSTFEQIKQGFPHAIFVILDAVVLLWIIGFSLWLVYQMARGALWLHQFLMDRIPASPLYVGMTFFWAWTCYFSLSLQLPTGEAEFEKLIKFLLVPLVLYATTTSVLLWIIKTLMPNQRPLGLLFLRNFSTGRESERLFRQLVPSWTEIGPIFVLSGPDIVNATLDSKMLTAFLLNDLPSQFISSAEEAESRTATIRKQRLWDLRYRVEELKCSGSIWATVFQKLLQHCDVVLVDLRGFSERNTGTAFELFTLLQSGQAHRTLLLSDKETSLPAVQHIARAASANRVAGSDDSAESISLIEVSGGTGRVRRFVIRLLLSISNERKKGSSNT